MSYTTDPTDKRLGHGPDSRPVEQNEVYLVLSEEERAKGFIRPVRRTYIHTGQKPKYPLVDLSDREKALYDDAKFVKYEKYPEGGGRFWTQEELDSGCGTSTTMGLALAETYARQPSFYGATYCCHCRMHLPVAEFQWEDGTVVGS